jgi:flagellin-like hook-associated protein FlgL
MRLRISRNTRKKLPISEEQSPLKTKENLEEYLQQAISFLQTQQEALNRTICILEEVAALAPRMKEDAILNVSKKDEAASRKKLKTLRKELKSLSSLSFNQRPIFSDTDADNSIPLFKGASPKAPQMKQLSAPHYTKPIQKTTHEVNLELVYSSLQAIKEMLGENSATSQDLHTCFTALASDPESATKLKFFEERVKTWVSEIIAGHDGLSVQAHILSQRVDNLVCGLDENHPSPQS